MKKFIWLSVLATLLFIVPSVQAQEWRRPGGWGNHGKHHGWNYGNHRGWNQRQWGNHGNHYGWIYGNHKGWNQRPGVWGHPGGQYYGPRGLAFNSYHVPYGWR